MLEDEASERKEGEEIQEAGGWTGLRFQTKVASENNELRVIRALISY